VLRLTLVFLPYARAAARRGVIDTMEGQFAQSGMDVPPWMERLRRELS
jgi:hypothetical protein